MNITTNSKGESSYQISKREHAGVGMATATWTVAVRNSGSFDFIKELRCDERADRGGVGVRTVAVYPTTNPAEAMSLWTEFLAAGFA